MMSMRSTVRSGRGSLTRMIDSTRGATTRFFSDKGKVLSEEERAAENIYIQKMEREKMEKMKKKAEKEKAEREKQGGDKKSEEGHSA